MKLKFGAKYEHQKKIERLFIICKRAALLRKIIALSLRAHFCYIDNYSLLFRVQVLNHCVHVINFAIRNQS